jgi:hypothetical protein
MSFVSNVPSYHEYADLVARFKICNSESICDFSLIIKQGKIKHQSKGQSPTKVMLKIEGEDSIEQLKEYLELFRNGEQILFELIILDNHFMLFTVEQTIEILQTFIISTKKSKKDT